MPHNRLYPCVGGSINFAVLYGIVWYPTLSANCEAKLLSTSLSFVLANRFTCPNARIAESPPSVSVKCAYMGDLVIKGGTNKKRLRFRRRVSRGHSRRRKVAQGALFFLANRNPKSRPSTHTNRRYVRKHCNTPVSGSKPPLLSPYTHPRSPPPISPQIHKLTHFVRDSRRLSSIATCLK